MKNRKPSLADKIYGASKVEHTEKKSEKKAKKK